MGQRGPKPKFRPKLVPGAAGAKPSGPKYAPGEPDMPKHLGKAARATWKRTVKAMREAGALAEADRDILAAYCVAVADLEALSATIDAEGLMVEVPTFDRNGKATGQTVRKPHPGLKWRQDMLVKVKQLAEALGLTPAARQRGGADAEGPPTAATNAVLALRERIQAARRGETGPGAEPAAG